MYIDTEIIFIPSFPHLKNEYSTQGVIIDHVQSHPPNFYAFIVKFTMTHLKRIFIIRILLSREDLTINIKAIGFRIYFHKSTMNVLLFAMLSNYKLAIKITRLQLTSLQFCSGWVRIMNMQMCVKCINIHKTIAITAQRCPWPGHCWAH